MSVNSTVNVARFNCNGVQTVFPFTFPIFNKSEDLVVKVRDSLGVVTDLVYITDYSVSATNNDFSNGGNVTTTLAYASGSTITILRKLDITQAVDYITNGPFQADTHEKVVDRLTMICQQLEEQLNRKIGSEVTDAQVTLTIPSVTDRAGKYSAWDAEGKIIAVAGGAGQYPVSPFMATVLDDVTKSAALNTLGAASAINVVTLNDDQYLIHGDKSFRGNLSCWGEFNPIGKFYASQQSTVSITAGDNNFHSLHSLSFGLYKMMLIKIVSHGGNLIGTAPNEGVNGTSAGVCLLLVGKTLSGPGPAPNEFNHFQIITKSVTNFDFQISGDYLQGKITAGNNAVIKSNLTIIANFDEIQHMGW